MSEQVWLAIELLGIALVAAAAGVVFLIVLRNRQGPDEASLFIGDEGDAVFLFDGERLVDASPEARALLRHSPLPSGSARARMTASLATRFPGLGSALEALPERGREVLLSKNENGALVTLRAELRGGLTRISLESDGHRSGDPIGEFAQDAELSTLRAMLTGAPLPFWREDAASQIIWANAAYLTLIAERADQDFDLIWPLPRVFELRATGRQRLDAAGSSRWYELCEVPDGDGKLVYALPSDAAVQAEASLKAFMQTLAKTFAHLPTGLAIFDANRKLVLFNPALLDLTTLPADFLSQRPALTEVLDAMRERAMIPEPRDYRSWKRQIAEMEQAANSGHYEATWTLPGGQTYRVTGRPHPNGALALMIEDISTEITRTRRYRADLELGQAVIDALDEAIVVFSPAGMLVMSNAAYRRLWGEDPATMVDPAGGQAALLCNFWRDRSAPSALWDRAEDFIGALGPRPGWTDSFHLSDGTLVACRFAALAGGATLAGFRRLGEDHGPSLEIEPEPMPVFARARRSG